MKKLIFIALLFIFSVNLFCETVYKTYDDKSLFYEDKFLTMKQVNCYSTINNYKFKLSVSIVDIGNDTMVILDFELKNIKYMPVILSFADSDYSLNINESMIEKEGDTYYIYIENKYDIIEIIKNISNSYLIIVLDGKYNGNAIGFSFDFTHMKKEIINSKVYKELVK